MERKVVLSRAVAVYIYTILYIRPKAEKVWSFHDGRRVNDMLFFFSCPLSSTW